jgi:hypothetical protein
LVLLVVAAGLAAAACAGGGSTAAPSIPATTAPEGAVAEVTLDDIALPGQPGGARAAASLQSSATSTTAPLRASGNSPSTPAPASTPTSVPSGPSTSTSSPVTTSAAASSPRVAYGPLALVQSGVTTSTFRWEQTSASPAGGSYRSVDWVVNGPDERVLVSEDGSSELIVHLGSDHWMTTASGTSQRVSEAEYLNTRRQWLAEPFATGVAAALASTTVNGPDRYDVSTSDVGVIAGVLGRGASPGSVLQGSVQVDEAGRVVQWDLSVVEPAPGGGGESATAIVGQLQAASGIAITAP